jgi:Acyl-CoA carboxylase epsilon subunit
VTERPDVTEPPAVADGLAAGGGPVLRVVSGEATPEEIAAVVAAVAAATADGTSGAAASLPDGAAAAPTTSVWSAPGYAHRNVRATFTPGPHGWRTSFWPR